MSGHLPGPLKDSCWDRKVTAFHVERREFFYPKADLPSSRLAPDAFPESHGPDLADVCRHHLGVLPLGIVPLSEHGTFHRLYRAEFDARSPVVIRVSLDPDHTDFGLLMDRWAGECLRSVGLPAVPIHALDLSRQITPFDYAVMEVAPGCTLRRFDDEEEALLPLLYSLGQMVARLHRVRTTGFGLLQVPAGNAGPDTGRGLMTDWRAYLESCLDRHIRIGREIRAINSREERIVRHHLDACLPGLECIRPSLLHGDLGNHNVFSDGQEITALIDWEDALSGDPLFEVASWATFHPERRHARFLAGYFSEQNPSSDFYERFWLYFLRIALCKTVVRHQLGICDRPGRPPASRRIQLALDRLGVLPKAA